MPRTSRNVVANHCYHVINRGNNQSRIFHEHADYAAFLCLMRAAQERVELPVLASCLMPNHIHLVVRPVRDPDLSRWMHWLFTKHVRHYHAKHGSSGRIWQDRYKAFVIQEDDHLLTVLRYVERNALRAQLVERAEHWRWGSLNWRLSSPIHEPKRQNGDSPQSAVFELAASPVPLPDDWVGYVNAPATATELAELRACVHRQTPFGADGWVQRMTRQIRFDSTQGI